MDDQAARERESIKEVREHVEKLRLIEEAWEPSVTTGPWNELPLGRLALGSGPAIANDASEPIRLPLQAGGVCRVIFEGIPTLDDVRALLDAVQRLLWEHSRRRCVVPRRGTPRAVAIIGFLI